ncbi:MAG: FtsQ-type POTRA domain-containing protein [Acidimicrobiales bacterium]
MTISDEITDLRPAMDPRMWQRRVEVTRANGRRRLKAVVALFIVCVLALVGVIAIHSELFSAKHVQVVGAVETPAGQVVQAAGLSARPPLVDINALAAAHEVEHLPWIDTASVVVHWPDSVTIRVTERLPVAALEVRSAKKGSPSWDIVDRTGRVLADVADEPAGLVTVVVPTRVGPPGTQLPTSDQWGVDVATSIPATLALRVESVDVSDGSGSVDSGSADSGSADSGSVGAGSVAAGQTIDAEGDDDTVTLGLSGGLSVVIGAPVELPAKFEALESVLTGASLQSGDVIDVTVPEEPTVSS